jgi:hypothetical protein
MIATFSLFMGATRWIAVIAIVFVAFILFVPVFPMTSQSGSFFGASYAVDADVSLSFLATHCGSYVNAHESATLGGVTITHPTSSGYNFSCNFSNSNQSSIVQILSSSRARLYLHESES